MLRRSGLLAALLLSLPLAPAFADGRESVVVLTVDQVVQEALERNLRLLADRFDVAMAEADVVAARLRPNPVLSLEADQLDPWTGLTDEAGVGPAEYAVRTDFLVERGGKRRLRVAAAEAALSIAQLQLLDRMRTLVFEVRSAAVDVLLAQANLALARENRGALDEMVRVNRVRVERGDLARVELLRVQLAALQFDAAVRRQELALRSAERRLRLLVGRPATGARIDLAGELDVSPPPPLDTVRRLAIERRPDYRAGERQQARSLAELRLQLAQRRLDLSVGAEYRRLHRTGNGFGVFVSVPLPVFDRQQAAIAYARAGQAQADLALAAIEADVAHEVEVAYDEVETARALLDRIEREMVLDARQIRQAMEFSYRRGEASLVEFLDAQMAFNETMETYNEARAEYARARYLLDAASGGTVTP